MNWKVRSSPPISVSKCYDSRWVYCYRSMTTRHELRIALFVNFQYRIFIIDEMSKKTAPLGNSCEPFFLYFFSTGFKSPTRGVRGTIPVCIFRQVPTSRSVFFPPVYVSTSQGPFSISFFPSAHGARL